MPDLRLIVALAALPVLPAPALAVEGLPVSKPGLWEITTELSMMPGQQMLVRRCVGPDGDADWLAKSTQPGKHCGAPKIIRKGGEIITEVVCKVENSTATTHGILSGDFQSHYAGRMDTTYAPPLRGVATSTVNLSARWAGPCPAGQKPGETEMSLPGGRINLQELMKSMPAR